MPGSLSQIPSSVRIINQFGSPVFGWKPNTVQSFFVASFDHILYQSVVPFAS